MLVRGEYLLIMYHEKSMKTIGPAVWSFWLYSSIIFNIVELCAPADKLFISMIKVPDARGKTFFNHIE